MKLKTKKIIAREIILLFSCALLSLLLFACIYPYNWIFEVKSKKLQESITLKKIEIENLNKIINYWVYSPPVPIDPLSNNLYTVGKGWGMLGDEAIGKTSAWCEERWKEIQEQKLKDFLFIKTLIKNKYIGSIYTQIENNKGSVSDRIDHLNYEIDALEYKRAYMFNKIMCPQEQ